MSSLTDTLSSRLQGLKRSGLGQWFYGREASEQKIIVGLATIVLLSLLWLTVWKPVADWRAIEVNRQTNAQQLFDWLRTNEAQARATANSQRSTSGARSLLPIVSKAADAHELRIKRVQPESNGVISVFMEAQSFNDIVEWIAQMEENNGVSIERASFDGEDAPGYVNANLRFN